MSVISNLPATPNRVEIICRYLTDKGERGISIDTLIGYLSPEALRRGSDSESETKGPAGTVMAKQVLSEVIALGLAEAFTEAGDDRVRWVAPGDTASSSILSRLERLLLDVTSAEAAGQKDFPRALAWFLAQDPKEPFDFGNNARLRIEQQCGAEVNAFGLTNAARAQNFFYWTRYLGYGWQVGLPGGDAFVVPDPTAALERHLAHLLARRGRVPLAEAMLAWAELCPVLEGGAVRAEVEDLMLASSRRPTNTLSRSTTLALQRLDRRGFIQLEQLSDAPPMMLATWPDPLPISHITLKRAS